MKKRIALLIAAIMLLVCTTTAYAAETKTTEVTLDIDPALESYTVEIPSSVTIDPATKKGACQIEIYNVNFVWSNSIDIRVKPENATTEGLYLINTSNSDLKIAYKLYTDEEIVTCLPEGEEDFPAVTTSGGGMFALPVELIDDYPGGGTYTDTWTFTITVK